jgi:cystathionine beta-lyase/cystathionine gamma-synthase
LRCHGGFGSVITPRHPSHGGDFACPVFSLRCESAAIAMALIKHTRLFQTTVSFGSVKSSVCLPLRMSHASASVQEQREGGITENLLRISVGIEDAEDLIADLNQALARVRVRTPC